MILKVDWCSYRAAKYAVMHWHYSKAMPAGKLVKVGAWEDDVFIGAVIFGRGSNRHIGSSYGLSQYQVCELVRVALDKHQTYTTKIVSRAIKLLKKKTPQLRLIVSYADGNQDHVGKIYQAGNWIYEGEFAFERGIILHGKLVHRRTINSRYNTSAIDWLKENVDPDAVVIDGEPKYKYLYPLDRNMRKQIVKISKPYPKLQYADS